MIAISREQVVALAHRPHEEMIAFLDRLSMLEMLEFDAHFECWAQPGQKPPEEDAGASG